jgi:hypothetical protein
MAVLSSSSGTARSAHTTPIGLLALVSAGALCAAATLSPDQAQAGPVVCPFRLVTGLPCPGCGMTRAWVFLLHGRVRDAVVANAFVLVTLPAAAVVLVLVGAATVRRRPLPDLATVARSTATKVVVVAWLVFAVVRLVAVLRGDVVV